MLSAICRFAGALGPCYTKTDRKRSATRKAGPKNHTNELGITDVVQRLQVVHFADEATVGGEFVMCVAPEQNMGFEETANQLVQVLQVDIGAPCSIFMIRESGTLFITQQKAVEGTSAVRSIDVVPITAEDDVTATDDRSGRQTISSKSTGRTATNRKTRVHDYMVPDEISSMVRNELEKRNCQKC